MIAFQLNKQKIENINVLGTKHLIEGQISIILLE